MTMKKTTTCTLILGLLIPGSWAVADVIEALPGKSLKGARGFDVEADIRNDHAAYAVRVSVDRKDRTYEKGELMRVTVRSQRDGHLYMLYKQADGSTKCLFPNLYESDNGIEGGKDITIPTKNQGFKLRCNDPLGDELLVAIVSQRPLAIETLKVESLTRSVVTGVDLESFARAIRKGFDVEGEAPAGLPGQWAEHSVQIKTVPAGKRDRGATSAQRIGLFIGISKYKDRRIRDLSICHRDATVMAVAMKEYGRLDGIGLLTDEKATRENIQKAFRELKLKSKPGDEIFIYWSGHGSSCADTGGDEQDGRDEFLVPHDGNAADAEGTMVLDDALGRWVQELDGRKVAVIFDACHSGGQATGRGIRGTVKGDDSIIGAGDDLPAASVEDLLKGAGDADEMGELISTTPVPMDLLDTELGRIKDIGQDDAAMLFSSASDEISAERRDGKLSVMTYFLVEKTAASSSLTLKQAYEHVKVKVPEYMEKHFPGRKQTPQLCPKDAGADVRLR